MGWRRSPPEPTQAVVLPGGSRLRTRGTCVAVARPALRDTTMRTMQVIKQIAQPGGSARDLAEGEAHELFAGMLDGGLPDLELGAALIA